MFNNGTCINNRKRAGKYCLGLFWPKEYPSTLTHCEVLSLSWHTGQPLAPGLWVSCWAFYHPPTPVGPPHCEGECSTQR